MAKYNLDYEEVLDNKLGIIDPDELKSAEAAICHVRMLELALEPVNGLFDFSHLKTIHERLFSDIYYFAGKVRDVDLAKGGSRFCQAVYIESAQQEIFTKLKNEQYLCGLDKLDFVKRVAYFCGELNALHPFREGNGRAIRIFLQQLAAHAGFELAYHEANEQELLQADIAAFFGDLMPISAILEQIVHAISE